MSAVTIECGCQQYEWGKTRDTSLVASLTEHLPDASNRKPEQRFAELWIGTHPSMPAKINASQSLQQYLSLPEHRNVYFSGAHEASEYRGEVPFLLKVLSISKALSIQAHPNKSLAQILHAKDPKNYKDPNHKPELIVALTPFEGLCCFRKLDQIKQFAASIPSLFDLVGNELESSSDEKTVLKAVMAKLYHSDKAAVAAALQAHQAALRQGGSSLQAVDEHRVFLRAMEEFPNDVGCWMVYILNLVKLSPGEGLFLRDSEPHAYLSGDGVEIMATSDNVVRAGLTPKFVDVDTLLGMMTYNTDGLAEAFRPLDNAQSVQRYVPSAQVSDFSLYRVNLAAGGHQSLTLPTCGLGICIEGSGTVNNISFQRGSTFACSPRVTLTSTSGAQVFIASTNDLPDMAKL